MNKTATIIALAMVLSFGYWVANSYASEPMAIGLESPQEVSTLSGSLVTNAQNEYLGTIHDFVIDHGRISFAILSRGGFLGIGRTLVAIPYGAFSYDSMEDRFILDISQERLDSAPTYDSAELTNRQWAEEVYKFYSLQPYWTEGEGGSSTIGEPMSEERMNPSVDVPYRDYGPEYLWP